MVTLIGLFFPELGCAVCPLVCFVLPSFASQLLESCPAVVGHVPVRVRDPDAGELRDFRPEAQSFLVACATYLVLGHVVQLLCVSSAF